MRSPRAMAVARGAIAMLIALMVERAGGQGTEGQFPDPISATTLSEYSDTLGLSPSQRHAVEALHIDYRVEIQQLRDGAIQQWLADLMRRAYLSRSVELEHQRLLDRIAAIDASFFDRIRAILSEEQSGRLERVGMRRERERIAVLRGVWWWQDAPPVDLSELARGLSLPPEETAALEPILQAYEPSLTALFRRKQQQHAAQVIRSHDEMARQGFGDTLPEDQEKAGAMIAASRKLWLAAAPQRVAMMAEVVALNRRTLASLEAALPAGSARRLRESYLHRMYLSLQYIWWSQTPFDLALARADLTDAQRETLQQERDVFNQACDATIDAMTAKIDAYRTAYGLEIPEGEQYAKDSEALRDEQAKTWRQVRELQQAAAKRVEQVAGVVAQVPEVVDLETVDVSSISRIWNALGIGFEGNWMMPGPITKRDASLYAARLGLDGPRQQLLMEAQDRYLGRYQQYKSGPIAAVQRAEKAWNSGTASDYDTGFNDENRTQLLKARGEALRFIAALDEGFFAEVEQVCEIAPDDPRMVRVRGLRERQRCNRGVYGGSRGGAGPGGNNEFGIDLAVFIAGLHWLDSTSPGIDVVLAEYEAAVTPALKARLDQVMAYDAVDKQAWIVEANARREGKGDGQPAADSPARELTYSIADQLAATSSMMVGLNREALARLEAALPGEQARLLHTAYERLAWPRISNDPACARPPLARALQLPDLTDSQRTQIEALAAEFQPAYDQMAAKMIESVERPDSPLATGRKLADADWAAFNLRRQNRERLSFERQELDARTWHKLRGLLTEEQAKAVGVNGPPPELDDWRKEFGS